MHGDSHFEYDEFGNLIEERRGKGQKLVTRYTYNCEHRLDSVTTPDGSTWHYEYDAFGRRIPKTNGLIRTEFLWQGDRLIAEETGDDYRTYLYEPDSFKPLALVEGHGPDEAKVYYYHLDHLGTPQELTNQQGQLVWSVTYRAYGNVVQQQVAEIDNPLRFQGQYHDVETGLHYNRHRYYNPNTGRFITPDPIGLAGGLNNYQYVPNPTGWVDPLGLVSKKGDCPGPSNLKVPLDEYNAIRARSLVNPESDTLVLGKYTPTVTNGVEDWRTPGADSYITMAEKEGASYFSLGSEWGTIQNKYDLSDQEMFDLFNVPVLDDAYRNGKLVKFSHDPREYDGFIRQEWNYIKKHYSVTHLVKSKGFYHAK